jgi:hypothetical protein
MSVIKLPLLFRGAKTEKSLQALFNSVVNLSYINPFFATELAIVNILDKEHFIPTLTKGHFIKITKSVRFKFYLHDMLLSHEFLVVPGLSKEAIIGAATMQKWRIKLNFEHDRVEVDPKVAKMQLI